MANFTIHFEEDEKKGRVYIGDQKAPDAEMTFSKAGDKLLIIDHTEVNDSVRGKGAGRLLLFHLVEVVRARNIKIIPLCPFAKSVFSKEESIRDVLR